MLLQSFFLYILLMDLFYGIDFDRRQDSINNFKMFDHVEDYKIWPLAKHRLHLEHPEDQFFIFYRTQASMEDFVHFTEANSTQAREHDDFYLGNFRYRSEKLGNLIAPDSIVRFVPGASYDRSIVRQYLAEYYMFRARQIRESEASKVAGTFWIIPKAVKDLIILTGQE
mmetsp:Transcript_3394/g.5720  ORF Transcript_3394/g.5720 Transcript_3394/m.5720 type:complete len:169 (-) Transcript_3394:901-1407(-)